MPDDTDNTTDYSRLIKALGGAVSAIGVALMFGNITGLLPTFPFAGFLTTAAGGMIYGWVGRASQRSKPRRPKGELRSPITTCPHCGVRRELSAEQVGKELYCLRCHHRLDTSDPAAREADAEAARMEAAMQEALSREASRRNARRREEAVREAIKQEQAAEASRDNLPPPHRLRVRFVEALPFQCERCHAVFAVPLAWKESRLVPCPECSHVPAGCDPNMAKVFGDIFGRKFTSMFDPWQVCPKCKTRIYVSSSPDVGAVTPAANAVQCSTCRYVWAWQTG